jgi:hypothetical protein
MGNQLLVMLAVVLAMVAALLPALIVAGIGAGVIYLLTGAVPIVFAGVLGGSALLVEAFVASEIVGAILDRSDISVLDAQEQ